ncbi:hypothetical protein GLOIN_2v1699681, partial [Rhizophagus irregularis DAOM 181602=DAOM 197198]
AKGKSRYGISISQEYYFTIIVYEYISTILMLYILPLIREYPHTSKYPICRYFRQSSNISSHGLYEHLMSYCLPCHNVLDWAIFFLLIFLDFLKKSP